MATTFQQVIDRARAKVNDADADRWTAAHALSDANTGILALLNLRPDIFFGALTTLNVDGTFAAADDLPCDGRYALMLEDWLIHRAEFVDDEGASGARSGAALQFFQARLTG